MPARLEWSFDAVVDVARLDRFLREKSPRAAATATSAIRGAADRLRQMPEMGRPRSHAGFDYRELVVPLGNRGYLVLYRFDGTTVFVLAVRHMLEAGYRTIDLG